MALDVPDRDSLMAGLPVLEPVIADDVVAGHLGLRVGAPVFLVERHSFLVGDVPGEFRQAYMRGDRYRYRIELR